MGRGGTAAIHSCLHQGVQMLGQSKEVTWQSEGAHPAACVSTWQQAQQAQWRPHMIGEPGPPADGGSREGRSWVVVQAQVAAADAGTPTAIAAPRSTAPQTPYTRRVWLSPPTRLDPAPPHSGPPAVPAVSQERERSCQVQCQFCHHGHAGQLAPVQQHCENVPGIGMQRQRSID